ncbi:hypothetical protein V8C86DRAFT_3141124 [Haematococcus lacustris]
MSAAAPSPLPPLQLSWVTGVCQQGGLHTLVPGPWTPRPPRLAPPRPPLHTRGVAAAGGWLPRPPPQPHRPSQLPGSFRMPWAVAATAVGAAAGAVWLTCPHPAAADAGQPPSPPSSSDVWPGSVIVDDKGGRGAGAGAGEGAGAGAGEGGGGGLGALRAALAAAWHDVEEDLERANARLPANTPLMQGTPPKVSLREGGAVLEVVVPLLPGADANAVLVELMDSWGLGGQAGAARRGQARARQPLSSSIKTQAFGTSKTVQLELTYADAPPPSPPPSPPTPSHPSSQLRAQLFVPPPGAAQQPELTITKRWEPAAPPSSSSSTSSSSILRGGRGGGGGGPEAPPSPPSPPCCFAPWELDALQRLVRVANSTAGGAAAASPAAPFPPWVGGGPGWLGGGRRHGLEAGVDVEGLMRDLEQQVLGPLFGGWVMGGMSQMMQELQQAMQDESDDDPSSPRPGPPYPSWSRGGGGSDPGGVGGQVGGSRGESAATAAAAAGGWGSAAAQQAVKQLQAMGAQVYPPGTPSGGGAAAGGGRAQGRRYEGQKRQIEDCLLLPLLRPDVYQQLAAATRSKPGPCRPRAVLFEGPPGTGVGHRRAEGGQGGRGGHGVKEGPGGGGGKTSSARVISSQAAVPLVYVPLEAVLSKWYGESKGLLAKVFKAAEALGGAIIFIDELDALGGSRDRSDMHEASRRLLSVLLREMDGFDAAGKRAVVIGATNRKSDLDAALLSRFDLSIMFPLPDAGVRTEILGQYAQQLSQQERAQVASACPGLSGRDLRDVCEHTERRSFAGSSLRARYLA